MAKSMSSISLSDLSWTTPNGRTVFSHLFLQFGRERVGIVGRNGVGKSTLLNLIAGDCRPAAGKVVIDGTVSVLRQSVQIIPGQTVADIFGATSALNVLRCAEDGSATVEELADADWTLEERIVTALSRVGLQVEATTRLETLSGGQRTRARLAAAIFAPSDFLLLDEPTNDLDLPGRAAVAQLVADWKAGLIVVSHDRALLEHVDAVVEMTSLGANRYGGNYSQYRLRKATELGAAERDLAHAQKQQSEVARKAQIAAERKARRDASGARRAARGDMPRILLGARKNAAESAGGGERRLAERSFAQAAAAVTTARAKVEALQQLSIVLPSTRLPAGRIVLELKAVTAGYEREHPIISHLSLCMTGPERVAVTGPNGAGKSTLLKVAMGELTAFAGTVTRSARAVLVDQQVSFLDPQATILDNFRRLNVDADENSCRSALAGFLFRADAALQRVSALSGGETLRAGLACRLGGPHPPELLILDEPTNHLDLESTQAIEEAVRAYDGALLVVSHDEAFLAALDIERRLELLPPIQRER